MKEVHIRASTSFSDHADGVQEWLTRQHFKKFCWVILGSRVTTNAYDDIVLIELFAQCYEVLDDSGKTCRLDSLSFQYLRTLIGFVKVLWCSAFDSILVDCADEALTGILNDTLPG